MSNSHRSHRRRKKSNAGRLGLAGALTGVLGIGAVAAGYLALKPDDSAPQSPPGVNSRTGTGAGAGTGGAVGTADAPSTGPTLSVTTPEGYGYSLGAAESGTDDRPLTRSTPPPSGGTYAYAEYVLTNTQHQPVLLDFPADIFVPTEHVPSSARQRCMPQPGVPEDMCTLPNHSEVRKRLNGSGPPITQDGDTLMPAGASYLVRVATDLPVDPGVADGDVRLFVWNARFTSDLKGIEVELP
ncbi:hypothetical protein [Thermomonospora umbrina]|uniref:Uncharacterized protein n=1 Tax=Thermomonospora umbrina TaxID=111806 RepID=A0A3D9T3D8_9ACTN|nr:hypothetical protein [Thermomonospora umbrina]REE99274.1 hypothetical protein DFJ69_4782 [Thermomonospora umbrina]